MTRYGWEKLKDILAEPNLRDLLTAYYEELWPLKSKVAIDPDWPEMLRREEAGIFKVWTARVDGTLAGFVSFSIFPHLMTRQALWAFDCGHFLHPAYRDKGRVGYQMWRSVEGPLRDLGVQVICAHDNVKRSLLPFFMALKYEPRATTFMKSLI